MNLCLRGRRPVGDSCTMRHEKALHIIRRDVLTSEPPDPSYTGLGIRPSPWGAVSVQLQSCCTVQDSSTAWVTLSA